MTERLAVCEVGLRDGLQNEAARLTPAQKCALVDGLVRAGVRVMELGSFVSAKAVPQMADTEAVFEYALARYPEVRFIGLVFNEKGYARALAAGCRAMAAAVIASETWSQRNSRMSTAESVEECRRLAGRAQADGVWLRLYLSAAWHCPFEGPTPAARVLELAQQIQAVGADEIVVADSIGHAHPGEVAALLAQLGQRLDLSTLAVHLHDTQALGSANAYAALAAGVRTLDASLGGLGGCPFAPGAAGNLATEDLVFLAQQLGYETGLSVEALWPTMLEVEAMVGRKVGGRLRRWWEGQRHGLQVAG